MLILLQRLEEPLEAGSVGVLGEGVAQRAPTAVPEKRLWDVGLYEGRGASCVLQAVQLQSGRLSNRGRRRGMRASAPSTQPLMSVSGPRRQPPVTCFVSVRQRPWP